LPTQHYRGCDMPAPYEPTALIEEYKIKCNEEIKTNRQRKKLKNDLTEKAQVCHRTGNYDGSYDLFCHLLAAIETDPYTTNVSEMRATVTANIASALQFLGQEELAKEIYERSLAEFEKVPVGWLTWLYYGNLSEKRMDYIRARLENIAKGEKPDGSTYQDGTGRTRHWSKEEMEGTDGNWSFFSPYSWLYGGYQPVGNGQSVEARPTPVSTAA